MFKLTDHEAGVARAVARLAAAAPLACRRSVFHTWFARALAQLDRDLLFLRQRSRHLFNESPDVRRELQLAVTQENVPHRSPSTLDLVSSSDERFPSCFGPEIALQQLCCDGSSSIAKVC